MGLFLRSSIILALAVGLYPSMGKGRIHLTGPTAAVARLQEPETKFFAYKEAVPGEYIVVLEKGVYTPADPIGGKAPILDGTDVAAVGAQVCA